MEPIIGIDLGTTNSEVAFVTDGQVTVICESDNGIVPSCVGLNGDGAVIVGTEARNQAVAAPERTVMSIKRKMGTNEQVALGDHRFTPREISAFILKALRERAQRHIGKPVNKAVITVPAYFTDTQRQATREAGEIAGLEVVRIINEPTAAALAYESNNPENRRILVYDLGGGTFDVSIVRIEEAVVEVLSSTGDNRLGGDDFDRRIVGHLLEHLKKETKGTLKETPQLLARLKMAAEKAKITLSTAPFAMVEEDHLCRSDDGDVHLGMELDRETFEAMIEPDLRRTMEAVNRALKDAQMLPSAIDDIILVGGSTRIPMIERMLEEKFNKQPRSHIDPDLCVAMGAGIQAAREMGLEGSGVLVDITPYTFGTSAIGEIDGVPTATMFVPLIRRNTKLPATRSELFYTVQDHQKAVDVRVYQGEHPEAEDNVRLGNYIFELTPAPAGSEIILQFDLDLNGILKIRALEKKSGKTIDATIENVISRFSDDQLTETRHRIAELWSPAADSTLDDDLTEASMEEIPETYAALFHRAETLLADLDEDNRNEIVDLMEDIREALRENRTADAEALRSELDDALFYLEG
jgi:molecular chaperone DnaK (HSP70)